MSVKLRIIDPEQNPGWDRFIMEHPHSSLFHHSLWKELIEKTFGYEPFYFVLEDGLGIRAGISFFLIKRPFTGSRLVSLPYSHFCDPLVSSNEDFELLLMEVLHLLKIFRASYLEFKMRHILIDLEDFELYNAEHNRIYVLELMPTWEEMVQEFRHKNITRTITRAIKKGLSVHVATDERDMRLFYHFHVLTQKHHGFAFRPYKFFKNMWQIFYPQNMLTVMLAYRGSQPAGGIVLVRFKDTMYSLYAGVDPTNGKNDVYYLLFWEAIKLAIKKGCRYIDFGRTCRYDKRLLTFIRKCGAGEFPVIHYSYTRVMRAHRPTTQDNHPREQLIEHDSLPGIILKFSNKWIAKNSV